MAKITYSGLVDEIKGSLGGSTIKGHKAGSILKQKTTPRRPRTQAQQRLRGLVSQLSGNWFSLSDTQKELWNKYASMLSGSLSGFNAFVGANTLLLKSNHADLVQINSPPPYPSTPEFITGQQLLRIASSTMRYSWTSPLTSNDYVQLEWAVQAGYDVHGKQAWHIVDVVRSDDGSIEWTNDYPLQTPVHVRARTLDKQGRTSPFTVVSPWEHGVPAPIDANTMLYLPMNENIGNKVMDHSGHVNNGTIYGASWTNGIEKYSLSFDGLDDYVNTLDDDSLDITGDITVEAWVKPADRSAFHSIIQAGPTHPSSYSLYQRAHTDNDFTFYINPDGTYHSVTFGNYVAGNWYHIAGTWDGTNIKGYLNGVEYTPTPVTGSTIKNFIGVQISSDRELSPGFFNGTIDEVRIYNRALSLNEIYDHYSRLKPL